MRDLFKQLEFASLQDRLAAVQYLLGEGRVEAPATASGAIR